jgi:hypothetical protein
LLVCLALLSIPCAGFAADGEEPSVLEVAAGLGGVSTHWDQPDIRVLKGGEVFQARATLVVPVSPGFSALLSYRYTRQERAWIEQLCVGSAFLGKPAYWIADRVNFAEVGVRIRL